MKKFVFALFAGSLFVLFVPLMCQAQETHSYSKLTFQNMKGQQMTSNRLKNQYPLLLIYFRTDCQECRQMAQGMKTWAKEYPNKIWMISSDSLGDLKVFSFMMGLRRLKNVLVLRDNQDIMHHLFDFKWLPFCVLYDKNGHEIKTYNELPKPRTVSHDLSQVKIR